MRNSLFSQSTCLPHFQSGPRITRAPTPHADSRADRPPGTAAAPSWPAAEKFALPPIAAAPLLLLVLAAAEFDAPPPASAEDDDAAGASWCCCVCKRGCCCCCAPPDAAAAAAAAVAPLVATTPPPVVESADWCCCCAGCSIIAQDASLTHNTRIGGFSRTSAYLVNQIHLCQEKLYARDATILIIIIIIVTTHAYSYTPMYTRHTHTAKMGRYLVRTLYVR